MSPEAQNIAIAESLGFYVHREGRIAYISRDPKPNWDHRVYQSSPMPHYCADLNLMHEAEKALAGPTDDEESQRAKYSENLIFVCAGRTEPADVWYWDHITATAAQRAEAYLRTIDKWEESP